MSEQTEMITDIEAPIYLKYNFTAGRAPSKFLSRLKKGELTGQRCPSCANVYIPPRGSCPACGVATEEEVLLSDKATVQSFTIVAIPIPNNPIQPPYVVANGASGPKRSLFPVGSAASLRPGFRRSP